MTFKIEYAFPRDNPSPRADLLPLLPRSFPEGLAPSPGDTLTIARGELIIGKFNVLRRNFVTDQSPEVRIQIVIQDRFDQDDMSSPY